MLKLRKDDTHKGYYLDENDNLYVFRFGGRPIRVDDYREDKPKENVEADVAYVDKEDVIDHRKIASPKDNKKFIEEAKKEVNKKEKLMNDLAKEGDYDVPYYDLENTKKHLETEINKTEQRIQTQEQSRIQPAIDFDEESFDDFINRVDKIEGFDERKEAIKQYIEETGTDNKLIQDALAEKEYDRHLGEEFDRRFGNDTYETDRRNMMKQAEQDLSDKAYTILTDMTAAREMSNDEISRKAELLKKLDEAGTLDFFNKEYNLSNNDTLGDYLEKYGDSYKGKDIYVLDSESGEVDYQYYTLEDLTEQDKKAPVIASNEDSVTIISDNWFERQDNKSEEPMELDYRKERATEMYLDGDIDYDDLVSSYFSGDKDFADEYIEQLKSPATKTEPDNIYGDSNNYTSNIEAFDRIENDAMRKLDKLQEKVDSLKDAPYEERKEWLDRLSNAKAFNDLQQSGETVYLDSEGNVLFKPQYYSKDFNRKIDLGIDLIEKGEERGTTYRDILDSVLGQMSDGIWENSPAMDKMWSNMDFQQLHDKIVMATPEGYVNWNNTWGRNNGWYGKTDEEVRNYLARKIKQVIKTEQEDGGIKGKWSRDNTEVSDYLTRNKPITVADAYELYDLLKGRK